MMKFNKIKITFCIAIFILIITNVILTTVTLVTHGEKAKPYAVELPKTDFTISEKISSEYYSQKEKIENMKLYVSPNENFFIQNPDKAIVSEGVHVSDDFSANTSTICFGETIISIVNDTNAVNKDYKTLDDIIKSYDDDGVHLKGDLGDFEKFTFDDVSGYKFSQTFESGLSIKHITYYTPHGQFGLTIQSNGNLDNDTLNKCINSVLVF